MPAMHETSMKKQALHCECRAGLSCSPSTAGYLRLKRVLDILLAALGLILASPLMLAMAIAIKCCDGGPVFYIQQRLTRGRRVFRILKFRSMRVDAESDGRARLAEIHDERITPMGRFMRPCGLDELPQLLNILSGSMSIVGPRPERPEIAQKYEETLPAFALRLQVKAGLTGYAQIRGHYHTPPREKLEMDLKYIDSMCLTTDIRIIFATARALLQKARAELSAGRRKRQEQKHVHTQT